MKTILCFGDSNTHGSPPALPDRDVPRYPLQHQWPHVMGRDLGEGYHVLSEGLPGRTTVHEDPLFGPGRNGAALLRPIIFSHKPIDLLAIMLGTNDLKGQFSVRAIEIGRSIERLVTIARDTRLCDKITVICPPPVKEVGTFKDSYVGAVARQEGLETQMEAVARRLGCDFVEAGRYAQVSEVDGVHWEPEAQIAMGHAMAAHVRHVFGTETP